jgi:hypothetical protein
MRAALQKPLWRIAGVAGLIALPLWGWMAVLDNSLISGPRVPVPETQQTVPYLAKGQVTVYVTEQQAEIATWLSRVDFGLLGLIILCLFIAGPYSKNSN